MKVDFDKFLNGVSAAVPRSKSEYTDEDGLLRCSVCHDRTQTKVTVFGKERIVRCICSCRHKELQAEEEAKRIYEREKARKQCFDKDCMTEWNFRNDDRSNEKLSEAARRYTEHFAEFSKKSQGLLLYGGCGSGKTFLAACIANRLIDNGYSVIMTNFATLVNRLQATFEGKHDMIEKLRSCSLLIIDDLGIERRTEYMQETVFNIIDSRYRSGKPMIITTNLTAEQLKATQDIGQQRIYDRILERCIPIKVDRPSRRREALKENYAEAKEILGL